MKKRALKSAWSALSSVYLAFLLQVGSPRSVNNGPSAYSSTHTAICPALFQHFHTRLEQHIRQAIFVFLIQTFIELICVFVRKVKPLKRVFRPFAPIRHPSLRAGCPFPFSSRLPFNQTIALNVLSSLCVPIALVQGAG